MSSTPASTQTPFRRHLRVVSDDEAHGERFSLLGIGVAAMSLEDTVRLLLDTPRGNRRLRVHFATVHTFVEASRDAELRKALADAELVMPDSMPVVWLGRLKGKRPERICGPDMMPVVLSLSRRYGYRHFFYGGTPEVVEQLIAEMTDRFPGLQVAGAYSPPFRPLTFAEVDDIARMINDADPDYVWAGLGSPKQDYWLATFRPLLHAPVLLAVGAAFDFHAGRIKRAPRWAQRWSLEWTFRLAGEPRRLARHYGVMSLRFLRILAADVTRRQVQP